MSNNLPKSFSFLYGDNEVYHAELLDGGYIVSWYKSEGHTTTDKIDWTVDQVTRFVDDGEWAIIESPQKVDNTVNCPDTITPADVEGVYRPDLTTRKVGKVRVELVDDGFPLALREVAKVMTWAQTAKGYKDHDWQNLPNAEVALAAAASRHRTDYIKQRIVDSLAPTDCVDHESKIVHKAHEAFGVLAQLELLLRGEFAEER